MGYSGYIDSDGGIHLYENSVHVEEYRTVFHYTGSIIRSEAQVRREERKKREEERSRNADYVL